MDKSFIASRIREERENCGLRQEDVAKYMGWDSSKHSIVVDLEAGRRDIKAWELYKLAELFHIKVEDFFRSISEIKPPKPLVLWRKKPDETAQLKEKQFLQRCEDYQFLEEALGEKLSVKRTLPKHFLHLDSASKSWANEIADIVREELNLSDFPAYTLAKVLEVNYGVRFLALSLGTDGSAACTVNDLGSAILLNKDEVPWRQTFSIAHELFHLITWDHALFNSLQPPSKLYNKNEQLADAFAAALLMPESSLRQRVRLLYEEGQLKYGPFITIAREYHVSAEALLYRLEYLGVIPSAIVKKTLEDPAFKSLHKKSLPKAYENAIQIGDRFKQIASLAFQFGKITRSRLARLLNVSLATLENYDEETPLNYS
jgi:Zn-dependent peptidase ImmA (M78 family)/transcriptional regulator with XRE-family HTH domain